jgi:hypothetical protein
MIESIGNYITILLFRRELTQKETTLQFLFQKKIGKEKV